MELTRIIISETGDQQIIYLKEVGGERTFPIVMQYNKQDLPSDLVLTSVDLDDALNFRGYRSFPGDALRGAGVFETLKGISELVLKRLAATGTGLP